MLPTEPSRKYPRTHHLPWSDTIGPDGDHVLNDVSVFAGQEVIVTEMLDGENTTLYASHLHARSRDSRHHPSRDRIKALHAHLAHFIPSGFRISGENCFARHSIAYSALPAHFIIFAVWQGETCLSWDDTQGFVADLEARSGQRLPLAPLLYRGRWNEKQVRALQSGFSAFGGAQEGYVVRLARRFSLDEWHQSIAKYVRPNHVRSGAHWMFAPLCLTNWWPTNWSPTNWSPTSCRHEV
jgi:hypothetical protein